MTKRVGGLSRAMVRAGWLSGTVLGLAAVSPAALAQDMPTGAIRL